MPKPTAARPCTIITWNDFEVVVSHRNIHPDDQDVVALEQQRASALAFGLKTKDDPRWQVIGGALRVVVMPNQD